MMASMALLEQLRRHEGLGRVRGSRTYVYHCTAGCRTVGYGHNLDAMPLNSIQEHFSGWDGESVTLHGADWLLRADVERTEYDVEKEIPWAVALAQVRREVLINMAYQLGIARLLRFKTTLRLIRAGWYGMAAAAMLRSKWARQTPARARELAQQMRTGAYGK